MVDDHDPGFYFVGKIFDRPLRSRKEEMEFCYGDVEEEEGENVGAKKNGKTAAKNNKNSSSRGQQKTVKFDWLPPNVSKTLVSEC